jgi:hypothetical protein
MLKARKAARRRADALTAYCVNLNEKAKTGKIDPLIGRMDEVNRTIQILCRRSKNNPLYRRRSRCRQDGNRRRPGQAHRRWRRARSALRCHHLSLDMGAAGRHALSR